MESLHIDQPTLLDPPLLANAAAGLETSSYSSVSLRMLVAFKE